MAAADRFRFLANNARAKALTTTSKKRKALELDDAAHFDALAAEAEPPPAPSPPQRPL